MFIMIDGIDGSGKSTIMDAWVEELESKKKKILSLKQYWKKHNAHPDEPDTAPYDVMISAEPTFVWIGAAIRFEMIRADKKYSANAIANAYALDRLILYNKVILPFLKKEKIALQDRGVSTSLCYQPIQDASLSMEYVSKIEGNAFALEHAPDHLIIADASVEKAMNRLDKRKKQDNALFEKKEFLEKAKNKFLSEEFQKYFTLRGTKIHILNTDAPIDIMKQEAISLLNSIIPNA